MKSSLPGAAGFFFLISLPAHALEEQRIWEAAQKVDQLVEKAQREAGVRPNDPVSDEVFLRRVYLDIAGRIPSFEESIAYHADEGPAPRSTLIRDLLNSEAYVSQEFHYWADLLRLRYDRNDHAAPFYLDWVKSAIREHMPYDEFVRRLVTAEGYAWDDPAVGFFTRDNGMPLDHMAFTVRVFLGTRMECAQCHNHPFDDITQKEFYHMAAFTYGTRGNMDPRETLQMNEYIRKNRRLLMEDGTINEQELRKSLRDLTEPLNAGAREVKQKLQLPHDYQYDDAKPKEVVQPGPLFGESEWTGDVRETFANWMTSPDNERFTRAITNRMWKKVMGRGLIEPEDNFTADTEPSNRELMVYLESLMRHFDYNLRDFQAVLYNTRTYQREVVAKEVDLAEPFYFEGPMLKRMSAERMWDSLLTLMIPEVDARKQDLQQETRAEDMEWRAKKMLELGPDVIFQMAEEVARSSGEAQAELQKLRLQVAEALEKDDSKTVTELRRRMGQLNRTYRDQLNKVQKKYLGKPGDDSSMMMSEVDAKPKNNKTKDMGPWKGWPSSLVRASELPSPAPNDHFLQVFGQSERDVVNDASDKASAIQALWLMNGDIFPLLTRKDSVLLRNVANEEALEDKRDVIFLSMLNRKPSEEEKEIFSLQVEDRGEEAVNDLIWSLLNSTEFAFVQ